MKKSRAHFLRNPGSFGISRKLVKSSKRELEFAQQLPDVFPDSDITPRRLGEMSLTLLEKGEMSRSIANGRLYENIKSYSYSRGVIGELLLRECTDSTTDLPIRQPDYLNISNGKKRLVLMLDDSAGILRSDVESIRGRIDPDEHWKDFIPHLTIATIATDYATEEILVWTQNQMPDAITLSPPKVV